MTGRTIRIVQSCTADEAAALVAAISAFEDGRAGAARPPLPAAGTAGAGNASGSSRALRKEGGGVLWTRTESSLGRGF